MRYILLMCLYAGLMFGAKLHYDLYKLQTDQTSPVLLIIGGIHGNEPGSYFAPSLFLQHYTITKGAVWVVPNLNRDSIIAFERGIYGDMNRKFATISQNDPDYQIVNDIKKLITDKRVAIVLNLHDGHGFYRQKFVNDVMNPSAWGQAAIIDQTTLDGAKYGNLSEIAKRVTSKTNIVTVDENHEFNVKNTETKEKDEQMRQSLTYFAISNNKPAFGVESSKNIDSLSLKTTYHLKALEEFMNIMGIEFKRDFELNQQTVEKLIADRGTVLLWGKIELPLSDIRSKLEHIPFDKNASFVSNNPNISLLKDNKSISLYNGFRKISTLGVDNLTFDNSLHEIDVVIDAKNTKVKIGTIVDVNDHILFKQAPNVRLNLIGYSSKLPDESNIKVDLKSFDKRYSIDMSGKIYRAEFYKGKAFCGAVMIRFSN